MNKWFLLLKKECFPLKCGKWITFRTFWIFQFSIHSKCYQRPMTEAPAVEWRRHPTLHPPTCFTTKPSSVMNIPFLNCAKVIWKCFGWKKGKLLRWNLCKPFSAGYNRGVENVALKMLDGISHYSSPLAMLDWAVGSFNSTHWKNYRFLLLNYAFYWSDRIKKIEKITIILSFLPDISSVLLPQMPVGLLLCEKAQFRAWSYGQETNLFYQVGLKTTSFRF